MSKYYYTTNWMGPVSMQWYIDNGYTKKGIASFQEESREIDEIVVPFSCGRIDVHDGTPHGPELGLPPMYREDFDRFSDWLNFFETDILWSLEELVKEYEKTNPKIRWHENPRWEEKMLEDDQYDEFEKRMHKEFPKIFCQPYGGMAIGPGWHMIIETLCSQIQHHLDWKNKEKEVVHQVEVTQIKEKFGGLRFYYNGGDDTIDGMVRMAELWCERTCQDCGHPGTLRTGGWMLTLCDEHAKERGYK